MWKISSGSGDAGASLVPVKTNSSAGAATPGTMGRSTTTRPTPQHPQSGQARSTTLFRRTLVLAHAFAHE